MCDPGDPYCEPCYGCEPDPTPPPPPSSSPIGSLDGIGGGDGGAWGWAFDPDASAQSIDVHFYVDGPAGSGQWGGATTANQPRSDVNQAYGIPGDHGYWFSIPPRFRDGRAHTLYVYGIDVTGNPNVLLSGVPKSFTLSATGSVTAGPNPIQVCDGTGTGITTLSWSTNGTTEVDVRVNAPSGALFATTGPTGSSTTAKWVTNGMVFYLQNASYGDRTSPANTLATVTVGLTTDGCAVTCASAGPDNAVVEYGAATHDVFAYGVQHAANVMFATWATANGQNDLIWYPGQNLGGGTWKATINFANHPESGPFGVHVYMNNSSVWCDSADFTRTAPPLSNAVWVEDSLPAGATPYGTAEGWNWVGSNPSPYSGNAAHASDLVADVHQHYFDGASTKLAINYGDKLYAYVYLDPNNTPSEVMLQWNDGTWEHRAYWGANNIGWGADGTSSRRYMGPLPAAGMWARLEVPASYVGLEGRVLHGMAFTLYGGRATWDRAGAGPQSIPPGASAAFVKADTTTQGNWQGVYGADGYHVMNDSVSYPAYAQVNASGYGSHTWAASTGETRATQKPSPSTDRLAACWYSGSSFTLDVNLTDGRQHQVALYALDWDGNNGRAERVDIYDAATGSLLDSRSVSAFSGGQYLVWNLSGHVIIKVTCTGIWNSVLSGLFFATTNSATPDPTGNNFSVARLDPSNRTGQPGTDLFSGNYNWGVPLAGLRGRAGLDLGLSLSYNSLVWTRDNSAIKYDADRGTPSAGFRLGFPVIENRFYNPTTNKHAYLMITPAGQRVELRQVNSSNVYEAADSSYLQLVDNGGLTVRTTDGTQLSYAWLGKAYRCTQIKDRNGNFMTVSYYKHGDIQTITDTLGRVVTFNYVNSRPISITQTWNGSAHTWATFGYSDIFVQPGFSGLAVHGPQNQTVSLLTQVGLDDGTRYNFEYAPSGQVSVIRHYAADGHQLAYTAYDFNASGTDCPRVSRRRDYAEDWNGGAEGLTTYADEGGGVRSVTMPDRTTIHKEFFVTTGWGRGLTTRTETWNTGLQKWTTTEWTQDDTALGYQLNPRPIDASVYDTAGNRKRTTIDYTSYGLAENVREWGGANGDQLLRRSRTYYNLDAAFINRRIIGLPAARLLYEGESTLVAKTEFHYDWGGEYFSAQAPSVQHDGGAYHAGFIHGRGNLSAVRRFNKDAPDDPNQAVWQQLSGYNVAGLPVFARDADWHTTQLSYADSFSDGNNSRNTLAYTTRVTDADGFSSTAQYNYDMGVATRSQNPKGMIVSTTYDTAGRVERVTNETSTAYTRFVYGTDNKYVQSFSLLQAGVESYSIRVFDGAGRVRATAGGHPGSAGGYRGQFVKYDVMGRAIERTNEGEINSGWVPAGDDVAGWVWSRQAYDWKGRPTVTTNADQTTKEASYGGCGCAGGEVVTLKDEMGRRTRQYADVLGRAVKTEQLNGDGSVYRTATNTYNALDQVTRVFAQAGTSGAGQETLMTYDGHGRLLTQKAPIQTSATRYAYNADDTVASVTDARGAVRMMTYNARHLVTGVSYSAPSDITATGPTTFGYDAVGNRLWMDDDAGRVDYEYNSLSQLTAETRQFAGLSGGYTLGYSYSLSGQVQSVTDPTGVAVNYNYDATGRLSGVTGTAYAGVSQYATGMGYRAFGALKSLTYGNNQSLVQSFNARQQLASMQMGSALSAEFQYYADGQIRYAKDNTDATKDRAYNYDHVGRLAEGLTGGEARDFVLGTQGSGADGVYRQTYQYDAWDNLTGRAVNRFWSGGEPFAATFVNQRKQGSQYDAQGNETWDDYGTSGRTHTYDAAGRKVKTSERSQSAGGGGALALGAGKDAASTSAAAGGGGVTPHMPEGGYYTTTTLTIAQGYDGDGRSTKRVETKVQHTPWFQPVTTERVDYYVRSSVLGGRVITELKGGGQKAKTKVYAGGEVIAEQDVYAGGAQGLTWKQQNPVTGTSVEQNTSNGVTQKQEYDPFGLELGDSDPYLNNAEPDYASLSGGSFYRSGGNPFDDQGGCTIDRMAASCSQARFLLGAGIAEQCRDNDCGPQAVTLTARNREGQVIGSSTVLRVQGQTGWNGSLDGTYRVPNQGTGGFNASTDYAVAFLNAASTTRLFEVNSSYGGSAFSQVSGGPQNPTSGQQPTYRPLTPEEVAEQRRLLVNTLENPNFPLCKPFMTALINELGRISGVAPYSNDPVAVFDKIAERPGAMKATSRNVMGDAAGSAGAGTASLSFNLTNMSTLSTAGAARQHEIAHLAASTAYRYEHLQMNQATFNILDRMGVVTRLGLTFDPTANNGDGTNYAGGVMDAICRQ